MRKPFLGLFLLLAVCVTAGQRTPEQAAEIAARFTNQQPQLRRQHTTDRQSNTLRLAHKALQNNSEEAAFYVFNQENERGFVIVSADDRTAEDVLLYSDKGTFDAQNVNPNFQWWLDRFAEEITVLQTMDDSDVIERPAARTSVQVTAIEPLLVNSVGQQITWYQTTPYNNLCPMDRRDNTRCLTGCVATAASMIMYKWRWPEKGTGRSSYMWEDCLSTDYWGNCTNSFDTILSVNYGETKYDWNNMRPAYVGKRYTSTQAHAVATLMYHAGVSCEMGYGGDEAGGSGTFTDYMAYGFMAHFGYKINKYITMNSRYAGEAHDSVPAEYSVSVNQFKSYFNTELEAGRPIPMGGIDYSSGGHAFVCDGRDEQGRFHINWGWEGDGNCYTELTSLKPDTPDGYSFKNNLDAIIGLEPNNPYAAIEQPVVCSAATKVLEDGQVVILRENKRYTVLGQIIQ